MSSIVLWCVLVLLLVVLYCWSAISVAKETIVVQTSIENFQPDLLHEKNPILITTPIVSIDEFVDASFKWVAITKLKVDQMQSNHNSYLLFWPQKDTHLDIMRPGSTGHVTIIIPANNVLILPCRWTWSSDSQLEVVCINTCFGLLFGILE